MLIALQLGIAAAFLIGTEVYHRWFEKKPVKTAPDREVSVPHVEDGAPIGLIFGRVRVRSPILVWNALPAWTTPTYGMNMFFILGAGMNSNSSTCRVHKMWAGDWELFWSDPSPLQTGVGGPEAVITVIGTGRNGEDLGTGLAETLNGNQSQVLANDGDTSSGAFTVAGKWMLTPTSTAGGGGLTVGQIPGYRGYISVFLYGIVDQWHFGASPTVPAYSFECSSYEAGSSYPATGIMAQIGMDVNPINALYDLIVGKYGKAGIDPATYIDADSFTDAATTLYQETHGYSRFIDNKEDLGAHIQEIMIQVDGCIYADETDGKFHVKLVRNDYVVRDLPHVTRDTAVDLVNFVSSGWSGLPNKVRISYTNRDRDYNDDSETAQNQANAVGQDGIENETVISMPGVSNATLAARLARRELAALSRPIMKCRALVDRSFVRVNPGDPILVTWTSPDLSSVVFRVAAVDRGTLENGVIALDLIQDYYYTHRQIPPQPPGLDHPDIGDGISLDLGP